MMTASELVKKHLDVANRYKTVYMWGCFGSPVTDQIIRDKAAQYPDWYTAEKQAQLRALIGRGYYGFDCVNLTKGLLWGWSGNASAYYGGAKYASAGVPDVSADAAIKLCRDVSTDFSRLEAGEALWMPGHWGVYIGDGLAVECTPIWDNGVQITCVGNLVTKAGYNVRRWTKHGKMPWVRYGADKPQEPQKNGKIIINGKEYAVDRVLQSGTNYINLRDIVAALEAAGVCQLEVGNRGNIAVLVSK